MTVDCKRCFADVSTIIKSFYCICPTHIFRLTYPAFALNYPCYRYWVWFTLVRSCNDQRCRHVIKTQIDDSYHDKEVYPRALRQPLTYLRNCFVANSSSDVKLVLAGVEAWLEACDEAPSSCPASNTRLSISSEAGWGTERTSFEVILIYISNLSSQNHFSGLTLTVQSLILLRIVVIH